MHVFSTLFAGLLFGMGLILSGMANPTKVQNFLDLFGTWDPSLAFVMGGGDHGDDARVLAGSETHNSTVP